MIYIQSNNERTLPHHFDAACAMYGAIDTAQDYRLTTFEEVQSGKFDKLIKTNLFVGSVEFMREVFSNVNIKELRLPSNSNRDCEYITLGEANKRVSLGENLFIKPLELKLFSGLVLDGFNYSCLTDLPLDTKVIAYKPFDNKIVSEWRVYILNNRIVDIHNYSGDVVIFPDVNYIYKVLNSNKTTFPVSYTIDIGILDSEEYGKFENVVIEYNDMWAIGNYGVTNDLYLRMLKERYFEIIRNYARS